MINRLKSLLAGRPPEGAAPEDGAAEAKAAAAALLVEAAMMDGTVDTAEQAQMVDSLCRRFELSDEEAETLVHTAREEVQESAQILPFTRTIKDRFPYERRVEMIEMLWEVAFADGHLHDYEANLVRRVAGLVFVSDQDSGAARKRAMARLNISDGSWG